VLCGHPEEVIPRLIEAIPSISRLYYHDEICDEECRVADSTKRRVREVKPGVEACSFWGGATLLEPRQLPFPVTDLQFFTSFRKSVESIGLLDNVDACLALPAIKPSSDEATAVFETAGAFKYHDGDSATSFSHQLFEFVWANMGQSASMPLWPEEDARSAVAGLRGGERAGHGRVQHYITNGRGRLSCYKETRNGMVGLDYSSKLAQYLASGCLTARQIYHATRAFEKESGISDENTYWIIFELLWRDYMKFYSIKYGTQIFKLGGPQGLQGRQKHSWGNDNEKIVAWKEGLTGYPFIDANMRELAQTGFMSNRGRQVVASFLVRDMGIDWRHGAEHFECHLLDDDPSSNYGNWQYSAGVGSDPREDRYFNVVKQVRLRTDVVVRAAGHLLTHANEFTSLVFLKISTGQGL